MKYESSVLLLYRVYNTTRCGSCSLHLQVKKETFLCSRCRYNVSPKLGNLNVGQLHGIVGFLKYEIFNIVVCGSGF